MTGSERDQLSSIFAMLGDGTRKFVLADLLAFQRDAMRDGTNDSVALAADAIAAMEVCEAEYAALDTAQH